MNRLFFMSVYPVMLLAFLFAGCSKEAKTSLQVNRDPNENASVKVVSYLTGDGADVVKTTTPGLLLMGGSTDVDAAINWFLARSGGGDIVVIRSTGADGYNQYMFDMVPVNSVETIIIDSRTRAALPAVTAKIRNAEALFIAGGDQKDYVTYWKDTPVEDAINYLLNTKKVPVGGTSAGLAILGSSYFPALNGSAVSADALANPYNKYMTLDHDNFIATPFLANTITDSHYSQRERQGRHITFLARMMKDKGKTSARGIGIDEETAVCVDASGTAKVFGINDAWFLQNENPGPETCISKMALTWNRSGMAVKAYCIRGSVTGNGSFDLTGWAQYNGGNLSHYSVNAGSLFQQ